MYVCMCACAYIYTCIHTLLRWKNRGTAKGDLRADGVTVGLLAAEPISMYVCMYVWHGVTVGLLAAEPISMYVCMYVWHGVTVGLLAAEPVCMYACRYVCM